MEQLSEFVVNHWVLVTLFCIMSSLLLSSFLNQVPSFTPGDAIIAVNRGECSFVDVRSVEQFKKGHIGNAINLPLADITNSTEQLKKLKKKRVIACCDAGNLSNAAVKELRKHGFTDALILKGGLNAWKASNYPLKDS
jgi:rhodanese-related sulfurtransferase